MFGSGFATTNRVLNNLCCIMGHDLTTIVPPLQKGNFKTCVQLDLPRFTIYEGSCSRDKPIHPHHTSHQQPPGRQPGHCRIVRSSPNRIAISQSGRHMEPFMHKRHRCRSKVIIAKTLEPNYNTTNWWNIAWHHIVTSTSTRRARLALADAISRTLRWLPHGKS